RGRSGGFVAQFARHAGRIDVAVDDQVFFGADRQRFAVAAADVHVPAVGLVFFLGRVVGVQGGVFVFAGQGFACAHEDQPVFRPRYGVPCFAGVGVRGGDRAFGPVEHEFGDARVFVAAFFAVRRQAGVAFGRT